MHRYTVHCIDCDSQNVIMYNAICKWDIDNQRWVYSANYAPMYQCPDCMNDSNEITEKENNKGLPQYADQELVKREIKRRQTNV